MLVTIFFPIFWGLWILVKPEFAKRKNLILTTAVGLLATAIISCVVLVGGEKELQLFSLGKNLSIFFRVDNLGRLFALVISLVWTLAGIYGFEYMKHEKEEKRYYGFYLMVYGVLNALCFSGNLITFYFFYELMSLLSVPMVLHAKTKESIMGGLKYLFYSLCGAYMVLFGIYFLNKYATTLEFSAGGTLDISGVEGNVGILLVMALLMICGFGVKAGMFPLHAWLPTAHPIAPAPASAVLSGVIVKMGVLGIVRTVYYIFGADFLRGTWVQTTWIILALITVFMGSMLAYKEKMLKKRLAYSTVSQASYILFGLALLEPQAFTGSMLHVVFHAFIKATLFLCAGAIIYKTGIQSTKELRGIGKKMPITIWCFTLASVALVGIPPASGFISKWHLAVGSLNSGIEVFAWLGPVVLLASALLTAGYLFPVSIQGFLPGDSFDYEEMKPCETNKIMLVGMVILAGLTVVLGIVPEPLIRFISGVVQEVLG